MSLDEIPRWWEVEEGCDDVRHDVDCRYFGCRHNHCVHCIPIPTSGDHAYKNDCDRKGAEKSERYGTCGVILI